MKIDIGMIDSNQISQLYPLSQYRDFARECGREPVDALLIRTQGSKSQCFDSNSGIADFIDDLFIYVDHRQSPVRLTLQYPLCRQDFKGLSNRHSTDFQAGCNLGFEHPLTGRKISEADGFDQIVGHLFGEALAPLKRRDGVTHNLKLLFYRHGIDSHFTTY